LVNPQLGKPENIQGDRAVSAPCNDRGGLLPGPTGADGNADPSSERVGSTLDRASVHRGDDVEDRFAEAFEFARTDARDAA
jgi:hypothetical protein